MLHYFKNLRRSLVNILSPNLGIKAGLHLTESWKQILKPDFTQKISNMKHQNFIDIYGFHVISGNGGRGSEKYGVNGGDGGSVILYASKSCTLLDTRRHCKSFKAKGGKGCNAGNTFIPRKGIDARIAIPLNTVIYDSKDKKIAEMISEDQAVVVAKGGIGGTKRNDYIGEHGVVSRVTVVLKILADVGFVGFPNAGKSTLLTTMSKAKPLIAPYAFTTLKPQIGHLHYKDYRSLTMADLPGLIEGAWNNEGLGHAFLRHVKRTKMLVYVVDINGFQLSKDKPYRSAFECIMLLNKELEVYDSSLLFKPSILVINKMDKPGSKDKLVEFLEQMSNRAELYESYSQEERPKILSRFNHVIPIAAKYRHNVEDVSEIIKKNIDDMYKVFEKGYRYTRNKKHKRMQENKSN